MLKKVNLGISKGKKTKPILVSPQTGYGGSNVVVATTVPMAQAPMAQAKRIFKQMLLEYFWKFLKNCNKSGLSSRLLR
jgi:hypothetical protein